MVEDGSQSIAGVTILFLALAWITVGLRTGVRGLIVKSFGLDDTIMVICLVLYTVYGACLFLTAHYGAGRHEADLTDEQILYALKYWLLCELFYTITTTIVKVSIGLFLLRIIANQVQQKLIWISLTVSTVYGFVMFWGVLFQCTPPSYFWDTNQSGKCLNTIVITVFVYIHSAISTVVDFILAGVPCAMMRKSTMNRRKKVAVSILLGMGSVGAISTLYRLQTINQLMIGDDYLYNAKGIAIWSWIEPGIGISAGSMATLRPLLRTILEKSNFSSNSKQRSDPLEHNLDELRCEPGTTNSTTVEAVVADPAPRPRRSGESTSDWQSFGSQEHLRGGIKKTVDVTVNEGNEIT